jgi:hypothetical protein
MPAATGLEYVLNKLHWMRAEGIWPNGLRYLWTDAFGVVLLVSLYRALAKDEFLDEAERVVAEVDRVLGRPRGIRIGEEDDRDGQYFHYLAMWLYALAVIGRHIPRYREKGIDLVHQVHDAFLVPGRGVIWKMKEDLSGPYPGYGLGALDAFDGYISLWMTQFRPEQYWAQLQRKRCLVILDHMWRQDGYFCREPDLPQTKFAFTNYGVSIGLQAAGSMPARVDRLNEFFESYRSGDEYDRAAITHVMACSSHFPGYLIRDYA